MSIESHVGDCIVQLDISHRAREQALSISRALIRQCANTIRATHRGNYTDAAQMLAEADRIAAQLRAAVVEHPTLSGAGYTQDALKEYSEAWLVYTFLLPQSDRPDQHIQPIPAPATLGVEPAAYLNGLAEAASELRRAILDRLRRNEVQASEHLLSIMDEVYSLLITVDYPEAITGGLRRTTDALRAVLERTRGDVTAAIRQERLLVSMQAFEARYVPTNTAKDEAE